MSFFKNSNHQQHNQQPNPNQTRTGSMYFRSNKKLDKIKRSVMKSDPNKSPTDSPSDQQPTTSSKQNNNNSLPKNYKTLQPTKVKSCSWKRSEKQISAINSLTNKKSKSLRKKSPTWLKFPNSAVKLNEKTTYVNTTEQTSVCRPGTLYSDVLFGAGSSCLVKVKNLTPRRSNNSAQKKLTKALFKYSGDENYVSDESEFETERNLFPSLQKLNSKISSPSLTTSTTCSESTTTKTSPSLETISNFDSLAIGTTALSSSSPSKYDSYEEADVVILSERNDVPSLDNDNSYGNYLDHHFEQINSNNNTDASTSQNTPGTNSQINPKPAPVSPGKSFLIDIPKWNFMNTDLSSEYFPRFLGQFDDENYLKAEKMALLGLKLALGNNSQHNKFKF